MAIIVQTASMLDACTYQCAMRFLFTRTHTHTCTHTCTHIHTYIHTHTHTHTHTCTHIHTYTHTHTHTHILKRLNNSGSDGDRLRKRESINKSHFSNLGNIIVALSDKVGVMMFHICTCTHLQPALYSLV